MKRIYSLVLASLMLLIPMTAIASQSTPSQRTPSQSTPSQSTPSQTPNIQPKNIIQRNDEGDEVVNIQMRLRDLGYFDYKVTGFFGKYTKDSVKKFQIANGLSADGQIGEHTKGILFSSKAIRFVRPQNVPVNRSGNSTSKGALVHWFKEAKYIYTRGSVARVVDVRTGISFRLKRTGGSNHADAEPVTSSDSRKMKRIWGGWSWDRRAVIVEVNGRSMAASMHAFPHAFDYVSGNGMSGHICVHFYKSRNHIHNTIDYDHQRMVKKAAGR